MIRGIKLPPEFAGLQKTWDELLKITISEEQFKGLKQSAETDLNQTISDPPTQAEIQAISDKIDALLAKLRNAGIIAS